MTKISAVINVGSDSLYLTIAERQNEEIKILEKLEYPLSMGKDTFTDGYISFQKVEQAYEIISGFKKIIKDYQIKDVFATGTTALREASNSYFIIDQIQTKTGIRVWILDDSDEKSYIFRDIIRHLRSDKKYKNKNIFIAYIGTGSLGIAYYSENKIIYTQNIKIGSLKIAEILSHLQDKTEEFYSVIEDYLSTFTDALRSQMPVGKIDYFIAAGREVELIYNTENANRKNDSGEKMLSFKDFEDFYDSIKGKTVNQISSKFNLNEIKSEALIPSMGLYRMLLRLFNIKDVIIHKSNLSDSILYERLFSDLNQELIANYESFSIENAKYIGSKFLYDYEHAKNIEKFCILIFDEMKKYHKLSQREKMLLRVAGILHDVGKYININNHAKNSYNIVKNSDIVGLSNKEIEIVANIVRLHSRQTLKIDNFHLEKLSLKDRFKVAKMLAILRIADSLDRGHKNKYEKVDIKLRKEFLTVKVESYYELMLEEWSFKKKSEFFEEVFGIKPVFKKVKL
ncbi:MAG: HD domain-containing protein [Thermotogota bacterium]